MGASLPAHSPPQVKTALARPQTPPSQHAQTHRPRPKDRIPTPQNALSNERKPPPTSVTLISMRPTSASVAEVTAHGGRKARRIQLRGESHPPRSWICVLGESRQERRAFGGALKQGPLGLAPVLRALARPLLRVAGKDLARFWGHRFALASLPSTRCRPSLAPKTAQPAPQRPDPSSTARPDPRSAPASPGTRGCPRPRPSPPGG